MGNMGCSLVAYWRALLCAGCLPSALRFAGAAAGAVAGMAVGCVDALRLAGGAAGTGRGAWARARLRVRVRVKVWSYGQC